MLARLARLSYLMKRIVRFLNSKFNLFRYSFGSYCRMASLSLEKNEGLKLGYGLQIKYWAHFLEFVGGRQLLC
jgi:hypothetical protein